MRTRTPLVGRESDRQRLESALQRAREGTGSIVLLAGEAGVGKSRLGSELAGQSDSVVLRGAPVHGAPAPYGPIVSALRGHLRTDPEAFGIGALRPHLALLLPELGTPAEDSDRAPILEAIRSALATIASEQRPVTLLLDDLQWSDDTT